MENILWKVLENHLTDVLYEPCSFMSGYLLHRVSRNITLCIFLNNSKSSVDLSKTCMQHPVQIIVILSTLPYDCNYTTLRNLQVIKCFCIPSQNGLKLIAFSFEFSISIFLAMYDVCFFSYISNLFWLFAHCYKSTFCVFFLLLL